MEHCLKYTKFIAVLGATVHDAPSWLSSIQVVDLNPITSDTVEKEILLFQGMSYSIFQESVSGPSLTYYDLFFIYNEGERERYWDYTANQVFSGYPEKVPRSQNVCTVQY